MMNATALAVLLMLAGTSLATIWFYDDPMPFQMSYLSQAASVKPADTSILEIIDAPYFPLLCQSFYSNVILVELSNNTNTVQTGSKGSRYRSLTSITFGEHLENNLKYAQSKSSLRIDDQGFWSTLTIPGLL